MMKRRIVFFDGVCGLCNFSVDFIMARDHKNKFLFSPLQSEFASKTLQPELIKKMNTLILFEEGKIYDRSTAVLKILKELGLPWSLMIVFFVVPPFLRNLVYDGISKIRYRIFGKRQTCRMPTEKEMKKFILS